MDISTAEASRALAAIESAAASGARLQHYRHFAPYMIVWGFVWLLANLLTDLWPAAASTGWLVLVLAGSATSFWIGAHSHRGAGSATASTAGWRWGLSLGAVVGFQLAALAVLPPLDVRQQVAFQSLLWTFLYTAFGAWIGWRLFAIGLAASSLTLVGYFFLPQLFFLYMGGVTGGSLIVGGLWMRRA